jgi:NAD-dependent SIR2 family protein deacetylase
MSAVSPFPDREADAMRGLRDWLSTYDRVFVLTGAGISTASGIPDYRAADGQWKRRAPITYQAFTHDAAARARYWARSFAGWPLVAHARPNRAHLALAALEAQGRTTALVTQNVDGLHSQAGQQRVIDLHGRIDRVVCLDCAAGSARADVQRQLAHENPRWLSTPSAIAPDGDADLDGVDFRDFRSPACITCGGLLKPDVVFFGENVPPERVAAAQAALQCAEAVLVVGSSLMVYSGYRFARMAHAAGLPLAILTRGVTRADSIATIKFDADCVAALSGAIAAPSPACENSHAAPCASRRRGRHCE